MFLYGLITGKRALGVMVILTLAVLVACGSASPPTAEPQQGSSPAAPQEMASQPDAPQGSSGSMQQKEPAQGGAPTAMPGSTPAPPAAMAPKPAGKLTMGQKELNIFSGHPKRSVNPQLFVISTAPVVEGLFAWNSSLEAVPLLTESWKISDDFLEWTFNIRRGVQFHKGYGEMTAEDVAWSYSEWIQNSKHARASLLNDFWNNPDGSVTVQDSHTLVVNTGKPMPLVIMSEFHRIPSGIATWVTSKQQAAELGEEAADRDIAGTGSWEIEDHRPAQFWKMKAVEDHWRKTPYFAELEFQEIPEESTRIAGFQTGLLDTFVMAFDSAALVEKVDGAKLMQVPDQPAGEMMMHFMGQFYIHIGTDNQETAYDPDLPWTSSNPNLDSPEWEQARKVRQALIKAIDVQILVDTLLQGLARQTPIGVGGYSYSAGRFPELGPLEYDLEGAKQLLADAGYPGGGFSIILTPAIRGAPAEVEVAEVIATMWEDIGVDVKLQKVPYGTYRPQVIGRTYIGTSNHATSPSNTPARLYNALKDAGSFVRFTHPWLEERVSKAQQAVDPTERTRLELEVGQFMAHNAIYASLYWWDAVWPVGPNIDDKSWSENLFYGDIRNINGFEWIEPRQ